jgi:hypothetical protein
MPPVVESVIRELETSEYPVRYVAAAKHGVMVISDELKKTGGREWMAYEQTASSPYHEGILAGIWVTAQSYQDHKLVLDCYVEWPDSNRTSRCHKLAYPYSDFPRLKRAAADWILATEREWRERFPHVPFAVVAAS